MTLHCHGMETAPASPSPEPGLRTSVAWPPQGLEKPRCYPCPQDWLIHPKGVALWDYSLVPGLLQQQEGQQPTAGRIAPRLVTGSRDHSEARARSWTKPAPS